MDTTKATVVKAFCELSDLTKTYAPGDTFSGTAERVKELAGKGYVEIRENPGPDAGCASEPKE